MHNVSTIIGFGEILWDMLPQGRQLGGAPANFAYHVSKLGLHGVVMSAVGKDALGDEIKSFLENKNIDSHLIRVDNPTGVVDVKIDDAGVPAYNIVENVAWDNIPFTPEIEVLAQNVKAVCYGSLAQRNEVSRNTIQRFIKSLPQQCLKVFDINLRQQYYSQEVIEWSMIHCDVLKLNDEEIVELKRMWGVEEATDASFCVELQRRYEIKIVIVTCGAKGSYVYSNDGKVSFQESPKVEVVDTVGAGDSFTAAFVVSLLKGESITEAHSKATAIAAETCAHSGAMY
ncbi:MAG: carbohydrate kinase [Muribaculaceae bacterium]|nr:carbohydrate kinase [Muribaculaceae bacterium]